MINNQTEEAPRTFNSLADIRAYKDAIKKEINKDEEKMGDLWSQLFHSGEPEPQTRGQKFTRMINMGAGMLDGALLGWKLYRKFGGGSGFSLFGKRKHSK